MAIARYTLAVDRRMRRDNNDPNAQTADFPGIVAFGRQAEFAEKYLRKGTKVVVTGRIQTGSYTNKDGVTVYTTDVIADRVEFLEWGDRESRRDNGFDQGYQSQSEPKDDFTPEGFTAIEEDIPF